MKKNLRHDRIFTSASQQQWHSASLSVEVVTGLEPPLKTETSLECPVDVFSVIVYITIAITVFSRLLRLPPSMTDFRFPRILEQTCNYSVFKK
jgi:hypothetical protein